MLTYVILILPLTAVVATVELNRNGYAMADGDQRMRHAELARLGKRWQDESNDPWSDVGTENLVTFVLESTFSVHSRDHEHLGGA